jgi:hypothetical protein
LAKATLPRATSAADIINKAASVATYELPVPAWGCTLLIQKLKKEKEVQIRKASLTWDTKGRISKTDDALSEKMLFQACVVEPSFTMEDIEALWQTDAETVNIVVKAIMIFNGMTKEESEKAEAEFPEQS